MVVRDYILMSVIQLIDMSGNVFAPLFTSVKEVWLAISYVFFKFLLDNGESCTVG